MEFRLLGPLEIADGNGTVTVGAGKRRSLLALLLLHPNEVISAERLIDELWGERPPATASKSLQVYVSQLRKELGRDVLQTRGNGYVACVGPDDIDAQRFERMVGEGGRTLTAGDPGKASATLMKALAIWRGPPLADFAYEPFAQREIARLEEMRLVALETRTDADLELGRHAELVGDLEALVADEPLRERLRGQLMLALYRCGRQAEALQAYREGRALLSSELGLEPGPALRELEAKILAQSPELAAPAAPVRRPPRTAAPPERARRRRLGVMAAIAGAAVLAIAAAVVALWDRNPSGQAAARTPLDLAPNAIAAVDAATGAPRATMPLSGRPVDITAFGGTVWVLTVNSKSLTAIDGRAEKLPRTVPLRGAPAAVAAGRGAVWVLDGRAGLLSRFEPGYEDPSAHIRFRRSGDAASIAVDSDGVWVTDGSARLLRADPTTRKVQEIPAGRPLRAVTAGAGAVWALSSDPPSVLRADPGTGAITDRLDMGRAGEEAPFPVGIAATDDAVWVLNQNTASVARIDPRTGSTVALVPIGVDRVPNEIAAAGDAAFVANEDGSLSRIDAGATAATSLWVGESLRDLAVDGSRVWVGTTAIDQQMPGGAG
jgi:DNA-binding SARP family transcriptional activator/streptogramin lyase